MMKWIKLTKNHYFGFFALGIIFILIQELPYFIMPLIPITSNPLMEMQDKSLILNGCEKILGVSCILTMLFLVHKDAKWFSLSTASEIGFFSTAMAALVGYFIGWIFYYNGFQSVSLMLGLLVAMPPIYYTFIGLWRKNYILAVLGSIFLFTHLANVWNNLKV